MKNNQIAYYLGSKILAAILNLITMAIFVRMGGKETYGAYIILLAWAYMLYSITLQWLRFSFFACFKEEITADLITTYLRALFWGFLGIILITSLSVVTGLITLEFASAITIIVIGLASYEALTEIARTQLQARNVAIGVIMRAILMLLFGVIALIIKPSAFLLALAVGLAHLGASLHLLFLAKNLSKGHWSKTHMKSLWNYGRPLIPAFGLDSVGLQLDRLLLARFTTLETVGVYGAAADFIRQSMIVVAEAISGAYFTLARKSAEEGNIKNTKAFLSEAFLAYTALTLLVGAFILRFDRLIFEMLFGAEMASAIEPIAAFIILSNIVAIYRAYYLSQAVYLTSSSQNMLYSDGMQVVVTLLAGIGLVPVYGAIGAAIAMFLGQVAGSLLYIFTWRNHYILQLPYDKAAIILAVSIGVYTLTGFLETIIPSAPLVIILNIIIFAIVSASTAYHFNILSFKALISKILNHTSLSTLPQDTVQKEASPKIDAKELDKKDTSCAS